MYIKFGKTYMVIIQKSNIFMSFSSSFFNLLKQPFSFSFFNLLKQPKFRFTVCLKELPINII